MQIAFGKLRIIQIKVVLFVKIYPYQKNIWGRTDAIENSVFNFLKNIQSQGRLLITVKKGTTMHYHPARVNIEIIKAPSSSLIETHSIK